MPPKKRKAATVKALAQPAKKVRTGDTSIIDDFSRASTPKGRPRRSTSNEDPQYNFTRPKKTPAAAQNDVKQSTSKATSTAAAEPRPRGRPRKRPLTPEVEEPASTTTVARRGILKNGKGRNTNRPIITPTRPNARAPGGLTASAAKRRSSESAQPASPAAQKKSAAPTGRQRGRPRKKATVEKDIAIVPSSDAVNESTDEDIQYWLMKAEPDSRIEKGHDVKFSIDDLAARTEPEGWDGVRNPAARNNMRAMRVGDLAFFYHSNTKVPGVAGVMRIVEEHSVDESAFDPAHPYYDPKSNRDNPKWELVKVEFVKKFENLVTLRELKTFAEERGALHNMQMLRQGRLSVSSVQLEEWRFILDLAEEEHSLGHPVKAERDGYESDTDGNTEGVANGAKTDADGDGNPGSNFDEPGGKVNREEDEADTVTVGGTAHTVQTEAG